jgi:UDP-N-acetylmuramyl pentapeptide phosphotransferase/UDP-N-acetylglucosamine-1-phosphate transferase
MGFTGFRLLFTKVAAARLANAVDNIDGFNRLASALVVISLLSLDRQVQSDQNDIMEPRPTA